MKVEFHPEAVAEFEDAVIYYEHHQEGLGGKFLNAIEAAIRSIQRAPRRWPILDQAIRRRLVRTFPYAVLYTCEPKFILIIAIMNLHQKPNYWRARASN